MIIHGKKNKMITAQDLPDYLLGRNNNQNEAVIINNDMALKPLRDARSIFEKEYLKAQLERFSGNISKTADFVGMERTALHRKLKALNIAEWPWTMYQKNSYLTFFGYLQRYSFSINLFSEPVLPILAKT